MLIWDTPPGYERQIVIEKKLSVPAVHCEHCVSSIEGAVGELAGVDQVRVDLDRKDVTVSFDSTTVAIEAIVEAIEDQGYDVGGPRPMQIGPRPDGPAGS